MEIYFIVLGVLIVFCVGAAWLLYLQMGVQDPRFSKGSFYPLEKRLLNEFAGLFEEDLSKKIKQQIKYFRTRGKYWRIARHDCYCVELYEEDEDLMEEYFFFPLELSADLARVRFKIEGESYTIFLRGHSGALFGWEIRPNPGNKLNSSRVVIENSKVLNHPEESVNTKEVTAKRGIPADRSLLEALLESPSLKEVRSPKNLNRLQNKLRKSGTKLPDTFMNLLGYADGMIFENGKIHGSRALLKIMRKEESFWPLAEFRGDLLGVRPGDPFGRLYLMKQKARKLQRLHGDFGELLVEHLDTFEIRS